MTTLLDTVKTAIDQFEWHDAVKNEDGETVKKGHYAFKLDSIDSENPVYRALSDIMYESALDENSRYTFVHDTLVTMEEALEDGKEADDCDIVEAAADEAIPIYTSDVLEWVSANLTNNSYVDDALNEYGWEGVGQDTIKAIQMGYMMAWREVYDKVLEAMQKLTDESEN